MSSGCLEDESMLCDMLAVDVEYQVAGQQVQGHLIAKLLPQVSTKYWVDGYERECPLNFKVGGKSCALMKTRPSV